MNSHNKNVKSLSTVKQVNHPVNSEPAISVQPKPHLVQQRKNSISKKKETKSDYAEDLKVIRQKIQQKKVNSQVKDKDSSICKESSMYQVKEAPAVHLTTSNKKPAYTSSQPKIKTNDDNSLIRRRYIQTTATSKKDSGSIKSGGKKPSAPIKDSNKNTIASIGNAKATSTAKNRQRVGSGNAGNTMRISYLNNNYKPKSNILTKKDSQPSKSTSTGKTTTFVPGNKLVMNNNEFFKKNINSNIHTEQSEIKEKIVKVDLSSHNTKKGNIKIEQKQFDKNIFADGTLKDFEVRNNQIIAKKGSNLSRKSSADQKNNSNLKHTEDSIHHTEKNNHLITSPQNTSNNCTGSNFRTNTKTSSNPKAINNYSQVNSTFKQILQNSKIMYGKPNNNPIKTTVTSKQSLTPKIIDDKSLLNEVSKKSLLVNNKKPSGSNKLQGTSMIATKKPQTAQGTSIGFPQSVEINNLNSSKNKFSVRPNSRLSETSKVKKDTSVIKSNYAMTEKNSPRAISKNVPSKSKISGFMNNYDTHFKKEQNNSKSIINDQQSNKGEDINNDNKSELNCSKLDKEGSNVFKKEAEALIDYIKNCKFHKFMYRL